MKKKKFLKRIIILAIICVLCIPVPVHYVGTGNIEYKAILYTVSKICTRPSIPDYSGSYNVGTTVEILGFEIYNDVHTVHPID